MVIAIIGVLASIVLVSLQGAKGSAELAEAQSFARQVRTSLGLSLVGEWRFENNTNDSSGYDNHGTMVGNPTYVTGIFGQALEFDGSGDCIVIDSVADDTVVTALTWESWIKTTDVSDNTVGGWNTSGNDNLFWSRTHGEILQIYDGGYSGQKNVRDGIWHHIAIVYNNGSVTAYIDGKIDIGPHSHSSTFSSNDKVTIGAEWDSGGLSGYFIGIIDEVRIYNQALTLTEMQQLYVQGVEKHNIVLK